MQNKKIRSLRVQVLLACLLLSGLVVEALADVNLPTKFSNQGGIVNTRTYPIGQIDQTILIDTETARPCIKISRRVWFRQPHTTGGFL